MRNWAGNVSYRAAEVRHPSSVAEVQAAVAGSRHVRAVGTGHSFNRIADTSGTLLSLSRLPALVEVDRAQRTVRVGAGHRYGDLWPALREARLALPNTGSLPHISIAGSIATATHGSGIGNHVLASSVRSLRMVTPGGDLLDMDRASHPDDFDGVVVSLGRLGVVVEAELDLVPEFDIAQWVVEDVDEDVVADHLTKILASAYSVSVFTDWAGAGRTSVWVKDRTGEAASWSGSALWGGRAAAGPRHPIRGMPPEHATEQMGVPGPWIERLPHFRLGHMPSSGAELQSEYFLAASHAEHAWTALRAVAETLAPALQVCEVRAIAADDLWLSPTQGEPTVAFHFTWFSDTGLVTPAVAAVESQLAPFDARPHWGKVFAVAPHRLDRLYPRLGRFRDRVESMDPRAKFANDLVDTWIGLVRQPDARV